MGQLVVLAFESKTDADAFVEVLKRLEREHSLGLDDLALAVRGDDGKVDVKQFANMIEREAVEGGTLGLLAGLLIGGPVLGAVAGTTIGAMAGSHKDYGIADDFIKDVSDSLAPGHAALFMVVHQAAAEKVAEAVAGTNAKILQTTLSPENEDKLRQLFPAAQ